MNSTINILLVEDNPGDALLIRKMLVGTVATYNVDNVTTLAGCCEQLQSNDYDLILLDLGLPDSNGFATFEKLIEYLNSVAVIILTGLGDEEIALKVVSRGAQDFLVKNDLNSRLLVKSIHYAIERSKIIEAMTKLEEKVSLASQEWQRTFDSINDSVTLIDLDQRVLRCNKATSHVLGREFADIVNQPCWKLFHGLEGPLPDCPFLKAKSSLHSETATIRENDRWLEVTIDPILEDNSTKLIGAVHIVRDVTESIRAAEEKLLLEQQFQQTQKLESLGILAGGIAHDFNNILTVIICNCSLLQQRPAMVAELVPEIDTAAQRAADLCRQMLIYAGKAQPVPTKFNVKTLVEEMVKMLKATINQNVSITLDHSEDIPSITADASQIRQVVMNLIINASEAIGTEQGTITVSLTIAAIDAGQSEKDYLGKVITPGSYICLEVTDNGCGMDEGTKRRIFEPFYTTKFSGRGLGMSAVLGIIAAHNGALQLTSQLGFGTTFKVYLPVQSSEPAGDLLPHVSLMPWQGSGTVLLVEDEPQLMMVAKALIQALGFSVIEAVNGQVALEMYQQSAQSITLVLTDVGMPVMDGYTLIRELKAVNPELPIIVSSGFGDAEVTSLIHENIAGCISKPYSFDQLREVLKGVVEGLVLKRA